MPSSYSPVGLGGHHRASKHRPAGGQDPAPPLAAPARPAHPVRPPVPAARPTDWPWATPVLCPVDPPAGSPAARLTPSSHSEDPTPGSRVSCRASGQAHRRCSWMPSTPLQPRREQRHPHANHAQTRDRPPDGGSRPPQPSPRWIQAERWAVIHSGATRRSQPGSNCSGLLRMACRAPACCEFVWLVT
jgi:hypothetical protein